MQPRLAETLAAWTFVPSRFEGLFGPYHAALLSRGELPVTLADARHSLELLTAFYHSAETERPESLPIGADHPRYAAWSPPG